MSPYFRLIRTPMRPGERPGLTEEARDRRGFPIQCGTAQEARRIARDLFPSEAVVVERVDPAPLEDRPFSLCCR
jgi:hypothetical protein